MRVGGIFGKLKLNWAREAWVYEQFDKFKQALNQFVTKNDYICHKFA